MTDNVVELLAERLVRLAPEQQEIAKVAACIGSTFGQAILAAIQNEPESRIAEGLRALTSEGFIFPVGDAHCRIDPAVAEEIKDARVVEYRFCHDWSAGRYSSIRSRASSAKSNRNASGPPAKVGWICRV